MKKIAVIGLGGISVTHIAAILSGNLGKIAGICDIKPEKIEKAKESIPYETEAFSDYRLMIESVKPDVVHICTPHFLHREMAIASMRAGADVYLEKPAALNYDEALEILAVQKETGRKVCVSFQNRVTPANAETKKIIDSGEMGKFLGARAFMTWKRGGAYYTESGWRGKWDTEGGGVLMNQSIHTLDLLYYFGGKIAKTEGTASLRKNKGTIEVEDTAEATLYYENGTNAVFYATNCNAVDSPVFIEIYLEKGRLMLREDRLYREAGNGLEMIADGTNASVPGKKVWGSGHAEMMRRFYGSLDGREEYYCTLEDGIQILKIIGDIYRCGSSTAVVKAKP